MFRPKSRAALNSKVRSLPQFDVITVSAPDAAIFAMYGAKSRVCAIGTKSSPTICTSGRLRPRYSREAFETCWPCV